MLMRWAVSVAVGLVIGVTVAALVGIPLLVGPASVGRLLSGADNFWGLIFGGFAGAAAVGLVFAVLSRHDRRASRWGRTLAGIVFGLFSAATFYWIAMWGWFSPFTLEGMWIYPLAIVPGIASFFFLRPRRRRRRGMWDQPPEELVKSSG